MRTTDSLRLPMAFDDRIWPETARLAAQSEMQFLVASRRTPSRYLGQLADTELFPSAVLDGRMTPRSAIVGSAVALGAIDGDAMSIPNLCRLHQLVVPVDASSGRFRSSEVAIGGGPRRDPVFVAPPHSSVPKLLCELRNYVNATAPSLTRAALAFGWLEWIHPFADGNGRVGRVVLRCLLHQCADGHLVGPLALTMLRDKVTFVEAHRALRHGDADTWVRYVANAATQCADALDHVAPRRAGRTPCTARPVLRSIPSLPRIQ